MLVDFVKWLTRVPIVSRRARASLEEKGDRFSSRRRRRRRCSLVPPHQSSYQRSFVLCKLLQQLLVSLLLGPGSLVVGARRIGRGSKVRAKLPSANQTSSTFNCSSVDFCLLSILYLDLFALVARCLRASRMKVLAKEREIENFISLLVLGT